MSVGDLSGQTPDGRGPATAVLNWARNGAHGTEFATSVPYASGQYA